MVRKQAKSKVSKGLSSSLKKHSGDRTDYGSSLENLPGGVTNGIAKLDKAEVGEYKSGDNIGKKYVRLAGVIVSPKVVDACKKIFRDGKVEMTPMEEVHLGGLQTSQMLPLCDTTNASGDTTTADEHIERMLNELRKLGGEECTANVESPESLTELLALLTDPKNPIFFKFSTTHRTPSAQYPEFGSWENWYGSRDLEDYELGDDEDIEETEEEVPEEEKTGEPDDISTDEGDDNIPFEELKSLARSADAGDEAASIKIADAAKAVDIDSEDEKYDSWESVVDAIREARNEPEEAEEGEPEEEELAPPEKGENYKFKPPRARNPVVVEVTAVFPGKKTCNLKNLDNGKTYKKVSWEKLLDADE